MRWALIVVVVCATAGAFVSCNTWSLKSDQKANDAVVGLKKLEAKIDTGLSYRDYSVALGETNFSVKQFLESDNANSAPEFSNSLRNAMKWYAAAGQIWGRELDAPVAVGYCAPATKTTGHSLEYGAMGPGGVAKFQANDLCDKYSELVTGVAGEMPTEGLSLGYAVQAQAFAPLLARLQSERGSKSVHTSPGLIYGLAVQESWHRAAFELRNAQHLLNGEKREKADDGSFKFDTRTQLRYLNTEEDKRIERKR